MDKNVKAWFANKDLFKRMLEEGHKWELHVADYLEGLGYDVDRPPPPVCGDVNDRGDFVDQKDLTADGIVLEVKSRNLEFTTPDTFQYSTVLIDTKQGFDAKAIKPAVYVCVSQITGAIIALPVEKTRKHWKVERTYDRVRRIGLVAYSCHRDMWGDLADVLADVKGCQGEQSGILRRP